MSPSPVAAIPDQRRQATRRLKKEVSVRPWRWRAVQECLLAGAEPDTVGRDGRPVLMDAALAGHVEIMRLLLDMGANVNGTCADMVTALMEAAAAGLTEGCQLLIARGAKVDQVDQVDRDGWTALMCAALNGHVDALRVLLDHGAKVDLTDHRGRTALHHATHSNVETAHLLLAAGADVNHRALDGTTALMTLTESPLDLDVALGVVPALIAAGADPLMVTSEGQTILGVLDLQHPAGRHATDALRASLDENLSRFSSQDGLERIRVALGPERSMRLLPRCMATQAQRTRTGSWRRLISRWVRRIVDNEGLTRAAPG